MTDRREAAGAISLGTRPAGGEYVVSGTPGTVPPAGQAPVSEDVRQNRGWIMFFGVALAALGIAAIAFPFVATVTVELLVGWILAISGGLGLVNALRTPKWRGFTFSLLGAVLSLAIGLLLLAYPLTGILSLTLVMAAFFAAGGVLRVMLALKLRPLDNWGWLLASGLLALVVAALILVQWPVAAAWVIGLVVGIDLLAAGVILIVLARTARGGGSGA